MPPSVVEHKRHQGQQVTKQEQKHQERPPTGVQGAVAVDGRNGRDQVASAEMDAVEKSGELLEKEVIATPVTSMTARQ